VQADGVLTEKHYGKEEMNAVSPEGNLIIGTMEVVEGVALAEITIGDHGELNVEYSGETEVDWNSQTSKIEEGERLFVCSQRKLWRESQVMQATQASTSGR
jgi:hypothetical protein